MKTSVEIDEKKLELARKLAPTKTLRELLDKALESYIAQVRRQSMAEMLGTDFFEGNLTQMRKRRGRTHR